MYIAKLFFAWSAVAASFLIGSLASASKVEIWKQDTAAAFAKAKRERVVVSDQGVIRPARRLKREEATGLDARRVWALTADKAGAIYAATGDEGKVFKLAQGGKAWSVAFQSKDTQVLSLATLASGEVFAGTGGKGGVFALADPNRSEPGPAGAVAFVWDLAADDNGNLYAACGSPGQLWKRDPKGQWSLLLKTKEHHLLSAAVGAAGDVYAGGSAEGLIHKVDAAGKASIVYDAKEAEIRSLLFAAGTLYAATADEAGGTTDSLTAGSRSVRAAENSVYAISAEGAVKPLFKNASLFDSLAVSGDRLLAGTGPEGKVWEISLSDRSAATIAALDMGQALAMLPLADGVAVAGGEPASVYRLMNEYEHEGTLTSDILDTKLKSRFGGRTIVAETPGGSSVEAALRVGNVAEPDATWSDWFTPKAGSGGSAADSPVGRFAQYRLTLTTGAGGAIPEVRSVAIFHQSLNLPPEITKIDLPDLEGAAKDKATLKWTATDPNGDELEYSVWVKKEGWPDWVRLGGQGPIKTSTVDWDLTAFPGGKYRVKVAASDRPSNNPSVAGKAELESAELVVDRSAPTLILTEKEGKLEVQATDALSRIVKAQYAVDGGEWNSIYPTDGLFDSPVESFSIDLKGQPAGVHLCLVKATDASGNIGAADLVVRIP